MPWNPPEKKAELFDTTSRFLLLKTAASASHPTSHVGYVMFRFDYEDERKVVYWYEDGLPYTHGG